ncbi:MAG: hypothetical protein VKQ33_01465 [Candidatus Sericytochromatia bacterium]|nr:hypothetical protein [Candidatus Sericytochromatia bacterium]
MSKKRNRHPASAQQRLVIVGNMDLIRRLAPTSAYWRRFLTLIQERFEVVSAWKVIEEHTARLGDVTKAIEAANGLDEVGLPALFIAREPQLAFSPEVAAYYGCLKASTKLAFLPTEPRAGLQGGSKPQPRRRFSDRTIFLGCSNYPACKGIVDLRPYDDKRMGSGRLH